MRSRMREIRTSGSVRGEGGNPLAYSTSRRSRGGSTSGGHGAWRQSCKTKPIPAGPGGTRPGGRGTWGKCAKRTQFPAGSGGTGPQGRGGDCAKQSQLPWSVWIGQVLGRKGVMMIRAIRGPWQNKPNFGPLAGGISRYSTIIPSSSISSPWMDLEPAGVAGVGQNSCVQTAVLAA
jgi:hypothetical protein